MIVLSIEDAVNALQQGKIISYPTEAVFGLGCCPQTSQALEAIIRLKGRSAHKGMIIIASEVAQLMPYIDISGLPQQRWLSIQNLWPGPFTWVFPATNKVNNLIKGQFPTVAARVTAHPQAAALCAAFKGAIISTSANISKDEPLKTAQEVHQLFGRKIAGIVAGEIGHSLKPTTIQDALTGEIYRS